MVRKADSFTLEFPSKMLRSLISKEYSSGLLTKLSLDVRLLQGSQGNT